MSTDRDELLRLAHEARAGDLSTWWLWDEPEPLMGYGNALAFAHACTPEAIIAALSTEDATGPTPEVDPSCAERWPECKVGAYDPRCCRFPKSCSCLLWERDEIDRAVYNWRQNHAPTTESAFQRTTPESDCAVHRPPTPEGGAGGSQS